MTQEVKNFSSGVLSKGGLIQKEQEREAKRQQEQLHKEAEEKVQQMPLPGATRQEKSAP